MRRNWKKKTHQLRKQREIYLEPACVVKICQPSFRFFVAVDQGKQLEETCLHFVSVFDFHKSNLAANVVLESCSFHLISNRSSLLTKKKNKIRYLSFLKKQITFVRASRM